MASVQVDSAVQVPAALPSGGVEPKAPISLPPTQEPSPEEVGPGGVPRTVYDTVDPSVYMGPRGHQKDLVNRKGLKLRSYFWPAEKDAKAVLLFVHGHGAHLHFELLKPRGPGEPLAYEGSWAQTLNNRGISVAGIDNQGCGRSEGLHGLRFYVDSFDDYVDDVLQLAEELEDAGEAFAGLQTVISGISLGGCIAFTAASRKPERFRGAVLLAPMLSLERASRQGLNPYLRPVAALLNRIVPTAAIVATDRNTQYPDIQDLWDADPLTSSGKTRVRNANEYLRATEEAMATLDSVDFPFLVFHSENDTMCDPDGSKQLYLRAKSADKTLRLVNHMWHVLVKEEGNERILNDIIEWIHARV